MSAPSLSQLSRLPKGIRPEIHRRFWAAVERALEKACAELPPALLDPEADDAADETEAPIE